MRKKKRKRRKLRTVTIPRTCPPEFRPRDLPHPTNLLRAVCAGLLLATALAAVTWARSSDDKAKPEKPYALLFGTVWGPDDHPVYGVKVKIRRAEEKKARWELYSDRRGEFAQRLPAGKADYIVWADMKTLKLVDGRELHPGEPVQVHIEFDERVDTGLHLK